MRRRSRLLVAGSGFNPNSHVHGYSDMDAMTAPEADRSRAPILMVRNRVSLNLDRFRAERAEMDRPNNNRSIIHREVG